eukprot:scaffold20738_cov67-Attheya_sp.AAC.4
MGGKECGSVLKKGSREAFSGVASCSKRGYRFLVQSGAEKRGYRGSEMAASSRSSFMDFLLELALCVIEGGWRVWGMRGFGLDIRGCILGVAFSGPGVGGNAGAMTGKVIEEGWVMSMELDLRGVCGLGVEFGRPAGAVSSVGTMAGFAVLGRFHHRKVGRN